MATSTAKKTYYPARTFDDDLEAFVQLYESKGWSFSNVDIKKLKADVKAQRKERTSHDRAEAQYLALHEAFGQAQHERYLRFADALNAARGAFRREKTVMAELSKFKRSVRKTRKAATPS